MRLFFDIVSETSSTPDPEGALFASLACARAEAILTIRELVGADLRACRKLDEHRWLEIRDPQGAMLAALPFADALREDI